MAIEIYMPRLTHDMQTGLLVSWLKKEGDQVESGDPLFEVETDKAVSEVTADSSGKLAHILFQEGSHVTVGTIVAYLLDDPEEAIPAPPEDAKIIIPEKKDIHRSVQIDQISEPISSVPLPEIIASPVARRLASESQVDLKLVKGSGPQGRIIKRDILSLLEGTQQANPAGENITEIPYERVPLTRIQMGTARRMTNSSQTIPQFFVENDANMSEAIRWRHQFKEKVDLKPSYTSLLIRVVARVLEEFPRVNSSFDGDSLKLYQEINIGIATTSQEGLLVPVIRKANLLSIQQIQTKLEEIHLQAKTIKLSNEYLSQSTFTVSNLGMFGIPRFQALVNPPEAAILAVGAITERPWKLNSRELGIAPIMTLRLSADHRVLDGAEAARFLNRVCTYLENPYLLL